MLSVLDLFALHGGDLNYTHPSSFLGIILPTFQRFFLSLLSFLTHEQMSIQAKTQEHYIRISLSLLSLLWYPSVKILVFCPPPRPQTLSPQFYKATQVCFVLLHVLSQQTSLQAVRWGTPRPPSFVSLL